VNIVGLYHEQESGTPAESNVGRFVVKEKRYASASSRYSYATFNIWWFENMT
jgi:hypothetical protein